MIPSYVSCTSRPFRMLALTADQKILAKSRFFPNRWRPLKNNKLWIIVLWNWTIMPNLIILQSTAVREFIGSKLAFTVIMEWVWSLSLKARVWRFYFSFFQTRGNRCLKRPSVLSNVHAPDYQSQKSIISRTDEAEHLWFSGLGRKERFAQLYYRTYINY